MESVLKTNGVIKKFGNNTILNGINMNINKGDIYGFIGKNGSGKTTFMRVVLSLTQKNDGEVVFFNDKKIEDVGLKIGSLIETPGLYKNASAYENLKRFSILYGADESKINELLELVGLANTGNRKAKDFSLGMRQRLGIAIALLGDPEFLLLDEPINGLDPEGIKEIRDVIVKLNKEKNITFLISSHLLDELSKIVTRYGILNNGVLLEEISAEELKEKCNNKLIIECDDPKKAKKILSSSVNEKDIIIKSNRLEILSNIDEAVKFNKELVKKDISVSALYPNYDSLEEYFMKRIGD
ncbi:MAG: ATP-binding cassette domain-containing protein [Bacilli bacterium]|nr:ATP-binding cassette domain-containing protein [Bacilli bacterium]MBR3049664.1 ATP-binding cassette domain-containing protein [Bacilli bacterium]